MLALLLAVAGCRQDMHDQPRYEPLEASDFFPDGQSARPLLEGTVPRGWVRDDPYFYSGMRGNQPGNHLPMPLTKELLERGHARFNIYCSPCHSRTGDGNGMIVQRGFRRPPSLHEQRIRELPIGHYFDVMTRGFGAMPDYGPQIPPRDRWAIAAYIRALQLSQNAQISDLPEDERRKLEQPASPPLGPAGEEH